MQAAERITDSRLHLACSELRQSGPSGVTRLTEVGLGQLLLRDSVSCKGSQHNTNSTDRTSVRRAVDAQTDRLILNLFDLTELLFAESSRRVCDLRVAQ